MRALLDAHAVIWYVDQDHRLSESAHAAITSPANELFISAGTIWELGIKVGLGKLVLSLPFREWMNRAIADLSLIVLPITVEHADVQASLSRYHGDPFDRLLVAQAHVENLAIVSADSSLDRYGISRTW